jgi:hypothetical protein
MPSALQQTKRKSRRNRGSRGRDEQAVGKFAGDAYSLAKRAVAGVRSITRLINIETKNFWQMFTATPGTTTTTVYLSAIAQGLTNSSRVGNSIKMQKIYFKLWATTNTASTVDVPVRILLVRDVECQGTVPTPTDILEDTSTMQNFLLSDKDYTNSSRFSVLADYLFVMPGSAAGYTIPSTQFFEYSQPHSGHLKFRGTDSTVSSAAEGAIFVVYGSSAASNPPTVYMMFSLHYTDD